MKILKWLLGALMVLAVVTVGGALLLPAQSRVERSASIARPPAEVFEVLNSFQRFNEWSPWFAADPNARYTYTGPATGVGAKMSWAGNRSVGSGSQEILESVPPSRIVNALDFGGAGQARATYTLVPEGHTTRVTWSLQVSHGMNPLDRWFGFLLLDRVVGQDFERGLAQLKALLEKPQA